MQGFLTFADAADVHLLQLPRERFTFGKDESLDLAVNLPGLPSYCGSLTWDDGQGTWMLETDAAARAQVVLDGSPVRQGSVPLHDGAMLVLGHFTMRFDLLPELPVANGKQVRELTLEGQTIRVGRGNDEGDATKLALDPEDGAASRLQAVIEKKGDAWVITDHGSVGTELNGRLFTSERLVIGDRFRVGHYQFEFTGNGLRRLTTTSGGRVTAVKLTRVVPEKKDGKWQEKPILRNVSMDVPSGSFIGILGRSGQGKSTMMTALCGLAPATSGTILFDGVKQELNARPGTGGHRIGFVPQDDIVHTDLSVRQAITFSARLRLPGNPPQQEIDTLVQAIADRLSLTPHLHKRVSKLSGGQRKRVSIATELLSRPAILFLDEPSSGLDPATEYHLMKLLRDLAGTDCTVLCTTHVLGRAYLFDRICFVDDARLVYYGQSADALHFFKKDSLDEVYLELDRAATDAGARQPSEWETEYAAWPTRPQPEPSVPVVHDQGAAPPASGATWRRTLGTLLHRQWSILIADPLNLAFLLAQAVAIAALIGWVAPSDGLRRFLSVVAVLWFGCSNAAQQIVGELPIFRRERVCGLGLHTYIQSKVLFICLLTCLQAMALFVLVTAVGNKAHANGFNEDVIRHDERLQGEDDGSEEEKAAAAAGKSTSQEIKLEASQGLGRIELLRLFKLTPKDADTILQRFAVGPAKKSDTGETQLDANGKPLQIIDELAVVGGTRYLARYYDDRLMLKSAEARSAVIERLTPDYVATLKQQNLMPLTQEEIEAAKVRPSKLYVNVMLRLIDWFNLSENLSGSKSRALKKDVITNSMAYRPAEPLSRVVILPIMLKMAALIGAALVGVSLGLMISALVRSATQAVMWVPLILIPQILLGGFVIVLPEMSPSVRQLSKYIPSAAAQRITETAAIFGQSIPTMSNRTRIPNFLKLDNKEVVEWVENGVNCREDEYERPAPSNTAFQNLVVDVKMVGQRHIDTNKDATVESRRDVFYTKGEVFTDLSPVRSASAILLAWVLICYAATWRGLYTKKAL